MALLTEPNVCHDSARPYDVFPAVFAVKNAADQRTPSTCAQTAIVARNSAMEANADASSKNLRTIAVLPELNVEGTLFT